MSDMTPTATQSTPQADPAQPAATPQAPAAEASSAGTQNTDSAPAQTIPYDRFKTVNDELKQLKEWKAQQEQAAEQAEQQRLAEQKNFEELYGKSKKKVDELTPKAKAAEEYEKVLNTYLEKEKEGLPAAILDLLATQPVTAQLEWLAKNKGAVVPSKPTPPNTDASAGNSPPAPTQISAQQKAELAANLGVLPQFLPG